MKAVQVGFDDEEFQKYWKWVKQLTTRTRDRLHSSGQAYLDIEYRSLLGGEGLKSIMRFLGVDPDVQLASSSKKRNPSDILSRFSNPDDVMRFLEKHDLKGWVREIAPSA